MNQVDVNMPLILKLRVDVPSQEEEQHIHMMNCKSTPSHIKHDFFCSWYFFSSERFFIKCFCTALNHNNLGHSVFKLRMQCHNSFFLFSWHLIVKGVWSQQVSSRFYLYFNEKITFNFKNKINRSHIIWRKLKKSLDFGSTRTRG